MTASRKRHALHYLDFMDDLDIDAVEEALGFGVIDHHKGEDQGYCLFPDNHSHGDTTGKMSINREKKVYHCWVCGGGTLLSLAMEVKSLDEEEATEWLYQYAHGDTRSDSQIVDEFFALLDLAEEKRTDHMPFFNPRVLDRFHNEGEENELYEWAAARGITDEVVYSHKLGYNEWVRKAAPMRDGEKIDKDYNGPCVVFPHFWEGRLVGWQHRWLNHGLDTPKWLPKYTNTSDFPKSQTLYNYDEAITRDDPLIVVESVPTALFLISWGYNAVAAFGSGIKEGQLRLLRRFRQGVILSPDNDEAGAKFVNTAVEYLERWVPLTILPPVEMGQGADLNDYIDMEDPIGDLAEHISRGKPLDITGLSGE